MDAIEAEKAVRSRFLLIRSSLNERACRLFLAAEALAYGYGGITVVARATGAAIGTIRAGIKELREIEASPEPASQRIRRVGAGRKKTVNLDPTLRPDLDALIEPTTRGDPESPLRWTCKSIRRLAEELINMGHKTSARMVAKLLHESGYSLQANRKTLEGSSHPDRDAQFEYINEKVKNTIAAGNPAVSVDTKKKELVGDFKNAGQEWRPEGQPVKVRVHDFKDKKLGQAGRASPYGVYDIANDAAWVSVGIDYDTAEFSVETIRRWWKMMGVEAFPNAQELLITADGGGSNGSRLRLWKIELQRLANELGFPISVCHFPPGTSKWNKIEHRLFSFITINWRGKPLVTHQVIVNLIRATTTKSGLKVQCEIDASLYPKGKEVTDKELAKVNLQRASFHGEWNYTVMPAIKTE